MLSVWDFHQASNISLTGTFLSGHIEEINKSNGPEEMIMKVKTCHGTTTGMGNLLPALIPRPVLILVLGNQLTRMLLPTAPTEIKSLECNIVPLVRLRLKKTMILPCML